MFCLVDRTNTKVNKKKRIKFTPELFGAIASNLKSILFGPSFFIWGVI